MEKLPISIWIAFGNLAFFFSLLAWGGTTIPDPNTLVPQSAADALVQTVGLGMDHRPFEAATALGTPGPFSFGVSVLLIQPSSGISSAISSLSGAGGGSSSSSSSSSTTIPIIPSLKIDFHKGISSKTDIGFSILPTISSIPYIGGTLMFGMDIKTVILQPEEGVTWAIRASYNYNKLVYTGAETINVQTNTFSPQVLVSKKMDFADPYLGAAFQYTYGSVGATIPISLGSDPSSPSISPISVTANGSGYGFYIFGGLPMVVPGIGFRITIEGAYSPFGMNSLGTKIGLQF